jgi:hypothetical protein
MKIYKHSKLKIGFKTVSKQFFCKGNEMTEIKNPSVKRLFRSSLLRGVFKAKLDFTLTVCRFASKSCPEKFPWTFNFFALLVQKKLNVQKIFSEYAFDAKRQTVSVLYNKVEHQLLYCLIFKAFSVSIFKLPEGKPLSF